MSSRTTTICFTNNKGGSGKSNYLFQHRGGNGPRRKESADGGRRYAAEPLPFPFFQKSGCLNQAAGEKNLYRAIREQKDLTDFIVRTPYENLDLIPSSTLMSSIEYELFTKWQRELFLKNVFRRLKTQVHMITFSLMRPQLLEDG